MGNKIKIGIDLDDVLSCFVPHLLQKYNIEYQDDLKPSDITSWEIGNFTKQECGSKILDIALGKNFFQYVPVMPHAQDVINWLDTFDNVKLYVVTSAHPYTVRDKADWIAKHFPCLNPLVDTDRFISLKDKTLIDLDFIIDDNPNYGNEFKGKYILFDKAWNQSLGDKYIRVYNWLDIMKYFKQVFDNNDKNIGVHVDNIKGMPKNEFIAFCLKIMNMRH